MPQQRPDPDSDAFADDDLIAEIAADPQLALVEIDRELVRRGGLRAFVELAWPIIEAEGSFQEGWHIDAICQHLEDVSAGRCRRLAINIPPRHMKSILVAVMWVAWDWIDHPERRWLFSSYAYDLAVRDSVKCRRIIQSPWFQARWGDKFRLTGDQNRKERFENDMGGHRLCASVDSKVTGEGGDIVCCFPAWQQIVTEHGPRAIGEIVEQRQAVRVWSYDTKTGDVALKPVIGWHRNPGRSILRVSLSDGSAFECTADHRIWTRRGWVEAGQLRGDDRLPGFAMPDVEDGLLVDPKPLGYCAARQVGGADVSDLGGGQARSRRKLSATPGGGAPEPGSDVAPGLAVADLIDGAGLDSVVVGDIERRARVLGNRACLLDGQFGVGALLVQGEGAVAFGVVDVLRAGAVGEVVEAAVVSAAVAVPDLLAVRRGSDEGQHDDLVHEELTGDAVAPHVEARVALCRRRLHQPAREAHLAGPTACSLDDARLAAHAAQAGHAVVGETGDRAPLLVEVVGHVDVTFCLTVSDYHTMMGVGQSASTCFANCDDPHNVRDAESEATRLGTLAWWSESMSSRVNDPKTGCFVIIQQRVHEQDLTGYVLKRGGRIPYTHLCLPARFETDHPNRWPGDPRTEDGELLWPKHMPENELGDLEDALGSYAAAGQLQQRPTAREGGLFKRAWFGVTQIVPADCIFSRAWDFAASTKKLNKSDPDWTATAKVGYSDSLKKWIILHVGRWRVEPGEVRKLVKQHADLDGYAVSQTIPQDPAQAGKDQSQQYVLLLAGWPVRAEPQSGDKMTRAMPLAAQASSGNVLLLAGDWNEDFLAEITGFPNGAHDDMVDAAASAFNRMTGGSTGLLDYYSQMATLAAAERAAERAKLEPLIETRQGLEILTIDSTDMGEALKPQLPAVTGSGW